MNNQSPTPAASGLELPELPAPSWYVVHTPGADFDYSFAKGKDELRDILDWSEAREDEATKLFTADQMHAYARQALAAQPAPGVGGDVLEALIAMEAEKSDYMIRNNLGDPAKEHTNKMARAAIAAAKATRPAESVAQGGEVADGPLNGALIVGDMAYDD